MNAKGHLRRSLIAAGALVLYGGGCGDGKSPAEPIVSQPGRIRVSVLASGGDLDANGFEVVVGSEGFRRPVSLAGPSAFDFAAGSHSVRLEGVAPNCSVVSTNPLTVTVVAGGIAEVVFQVECETTGIVVTTRTTGSHFPGNYQLLVNSLPSVPIPVNGSLVVGRLAPRAHTVALSVQALNCAVTSAQSITVLVENRAVTPLEFEISCEAPIRLESIAYTVISPIRPQTYGIGLVKPDGTGAYEVATGHSPAWAPDGTKLVFSTTECDEYYYDHCAGGLVIVDPETRELTVPSGGEYGHDPAWSPRGDAIAFTQCCDYGNTSRLYVLPLGPSHGGTAIPIVMPSLLSAQYPAWSPDGQRLAFSCKMFRDNFDICVINADGSGLDRLTSDTTQQMHPAWRPDGGAIAFTIYGGTTPELGTIAATGGAVTAITSGEKPAWSRDGTKLLFQRGLYLFIADADGSNVTQLMPGPGNDPAWRP